MPRQPAPPPPMNVTSESSTVAWLFATGDGEKLASAPLGSVETKSELETTSELFWPKIGLGPTLRTRRTTVAVVHVARPMPVNCESSTVPTMPKYEDPVPTI